MTNRVALRVVRAFALVGAHSATAALLAAQVPVRQLPPIAVQSTITVGTLSSLRVLSDGSVLVSDGTVRRVTKLDHELANARVGMDTAGGTTLVLHGMVPFFGDSSLYAESPVSTTPTLRVLDANGVPRREISSSARRQISALATSTNGRARLDPRGRLVFGATPSTPLPPRPQPGEPYPFPFPSRPDSNVVVRWDFSTGAVDTVAKFKALIASKMVDDGDGQGTLKVKTIYNPLAAGDDWVMLSDGTIAIVRERDYHIDWIDPNGQRHATAKLPIEWRQLSTRDKQQAIDSSRALQERLDSIGNARAKATGTPPRPRLYGFPPLDSLRDYDPPFRVSATRVDYDDNIWIQSYRPGIRTGLLYDVVNRQGVLMYRMQLPADYSLFGFGPRGDVYLIHFVGNTGYLARTTLTQR